MARAPTYTHSQGQVLRRGEVITPIYAQALLQSHRDAAVMDRRRRMPESAKISQGLAEQLAIAIEAAADFNRHMAARTTPAQQRQKAATVKRIRQATRQGRGMRG